ncbi:MAG: hypothetical protein RMJ98_06680 [Myxococcales bacterium]|nr:hypothetical protein [Polyangiaceae bacterium]MDW8248970.1 hypothetical protein [Myxococcales bacterium]
MNVRVRALVCSFALSAVLPWLSPVLPAVVLAQDDATTVEARKRFLEGVKFFDEKKYDLARVAFFQAYTLKKHPDVLLNLAQAELLGGRYLEAAQHFKEFLRDTANDKNPKRPDAAKGLEEARLHLGRIQITVDLPDADVYLNGTKVGTSPMADALEVLPGKHSIEARKERKSTIQSLEVPEGKTTIVNLILDTSATTAPVAPPATTRESSPAPSTSSASPAPSTPPKEDTSGSAILSTDNLSSEHREPFMQWAKRHPVAYTGAGLTAIGLGLGIGFGIAAQVAQGNADTLTNKIKSTAAKDQALINQNRQTNPCAYPVPVGDAGNYGKACTNLRNNLDAADTNRKVMTVGIVVGGLGVATIVAGYFLTAKRSEEGAFLPAPRFFLAPMVDPQHAGLAASGSF